MAGMENPELRAAQENLRQAGLEIRGARNALLPSVAIDLNYGIEANRFALNSVIAAAPDFGVLPNLGYYLVADLRIPVFDWGVLRSKVRQAQTREQQARIELTQTQRLLISNLYSFYNEALTARALVDGLRQTADLAAESLRLIELRYQAGESSALEVVDAQKTLVDSRNAFNDAQARYRVALANLQTITGVF
jgi:outer membrane protein TolC